MTQRTRRIPGQVLARRTIKKVRRYLLWDCSSCHTTGINANTCKQCPQCGNTKELDDHREREYRSATPVNKNYQHRGADISCQYCGTENQKRFSCRNCGAALDTKFQKQVERFPAKTDSEWRQRQVQVTTSGAVDTVTNTPSDTPPAPPRIRPSARTRVREVEQKVVRAAVSLKEPEVRHNPRTWLIIAVLCLVVTGLGYFAFTAYQKYHTLTDSYAKVTNVSWSYSLPLEDYAPRDKAHTTEDDWWRPPPEAINVRDRDVLVRTEDIMDSVWVTKTCSRTEDNSYNDTDGTWVQQVDVVDYDCSGYETQKVGEEDIWGTRWNYQLYEWAATTPLTAGGKDHNVVFPLFTPTNTLRASDEAVTSFVINFSYVNHEEEAQTSTRSVERTFWEEVQVGERFRAIVDGFGSLRAVADIDANYDELHNRLR